VSVVTLRFQGRFLYAEHTKNKTLDVVAPRFPTATFDEHRPMMSINHESVKFKDGARVITTFDPSFRIMSDREVRDPQVMVWDLTGVTATYATAEKANGEVMPGEGKFDGKTVPIDIFGVDTLEANEERPAKRKDDNVLIAGHDWASAIVKVTHQGKATTVGESVPFRYSEEDRAVAKDPAAVNELGKQTDLVNFPAERVDFAVKPTKPAAYLVLSFKRGRKELGDVCVSPGGVVCFSNSCADIHEPIGVDLEFSRYYDMLEKHHAKALIPWDGQSPDKGELRAKAITIEGIPCYQQSRLRFDK
jgi:hypothetical protein